MIIGPLNSRAEGDTTVVSAPIQTDSACLDLQYALPRGPLNNRVDPFVAAALLPAMKLGQPLQIAGRASRKLLRAIATIQQIFHCWDPSLQLVPISVETESEAVPAGRRGVGCLFSGGVDSFYTVLKHLEEIDSLILVHGFDSAVEDQDIQREVARSLGEAASELGKPLIEVKTNVRAFLDPYVSWEFTHGAAAASVALLLAPLFSKIYIASTFSYAELIPWGSHPLLDPLWSTEDMELVHDGSETARVHKTMHIATHPTALRHLRVCPENRGSVTNCGRCGKCLRAMVALELIGALERCPTLAVPLSVDAVAQMDLTETHARVLAEELLEELEARGGDPAMGQALRTALARVQPRIIERQQEEITRLAQGLTSTQAWARELEAAAIARDRDLARINRMLPVKLARRVRRLLP
jgi:hypothetical protein